ncbi:MAG: sodium:calcium antiporter [Halanaerobiaceae bacterium]
MLWLELFIYAAIIIFTATFLTKAADVIAARTKLGEVAVGAILLALATSLPELVTGGAAASIMAPDLALGGIIGSNIFNLAILAVLDIVEGPGPMLLKMNLSHLLPGLFSLLIGAVIASAIILYKIAGIPAIDFRLGLDSILILLIYLIGFRLIIRFGSRERDEGLFEFMAGEGAVERDTPLPEISLYQAYLIFAVSSLIIVITGIRLTNVVDQLAQVTGLGHTFFGPVFLAAVTSLPELATTLSAIKIGAFNLAAGNVLGSNIFNLIILVWIDFFYPGSVLADVNLTNLIPIMAFMVMTLIIMISLFYRSKRSILRLGWGSASILVIYILTIYLLYRLGITMII